MANEDTFEARTALLRKRAEELAIPESVMEEASAAIAEAGMKFQGAARQLRLEWLNDILAGKPALFREARLDPGRLFLDWAKRRAADRYHVTWRAVEQVGRRLNPEIANRLALIVWPQEIAWAQRMRLSDNQHAVVRAAMFLREAEGNPARVFIALADIYENAFTLSEYSENAAHEASPQEIRFGTSSLDFTPLFVRYAARSYTEALHTMPRDRLEAAAARARKDEVRERALIASASAVSAATRFPMRRMLNVVATATSNGMSANALYRAEHAFLDRLRAGDVEVDSRSRIPLAEFIAVLSDPAARTRLVASASVDPVDATAARWEISRHHRRWLSDLPDSFSRFAGLQESLAEWQQAVVSGEREAPHDSVSDFGFFLYRKENA